MILENSDRRVLAGLRLIDGTSLTAVAGAMRITYGAEPAEGFRLVRNSRGDYVLLRAPGFDGYTGAFQNAPAVPVQTVPLLIVDPSGRYLPRRTQLTLPRDPDPAHPDSVFVAAQIRLYPAPAAPTEMSWAVIRGTARDAATGQRLPWAFLRVLRADDGSPLANGQADGRGEALVAVPGILITMPGAGAGAVLTTELEVKLRAQFDGTLRTIGDGDLRPGAVFNPGYMPDPDGLSAQPDKPAQLRIGGLAPADTGKLAAGRVLVADILVALA